MIHATLKSYITGFILSLAFTFTAYFAVSNQLFNNQILIAAILILAIVQFIFQLIFFLHLGKDTDGKWNVGFLLSTIGIVLLVVIGSLWIMAHLNYNHLTAPETDNYLLQKEGFTK